MIEMTLKQEIRLQLQRFLLGEVSSNLRRVSFKIEDKTVITRWEFYSEPDEDDKETMSCVGTEIISQYLDINVREEVIVRDAPDVEEAGWIAVFQRR